MLRKILYSFILGLTILSNAKAQTSKSDPNDFEGWAGIDFKINLPKKFDVDFSYQLRTDSDISRYKGSYFTPEIGYKLSKKIKSFGNFRYATTINGNSSRIGGGFEYSDEIQKMKISFKPHIQYTIRYAEDGDVSNTSKWILRTKLGVKYPLSKNVDIYTSTEPFFTFDKTAYFIDNVRNTVGVKFEYAKNKKIDLFYIYRPDFEKSYNRNFHIIGVSLDFDFKIK